MATFDEEGEGNSEAQFRVALDKMEIVDVELQ
jgi:hypothetical protein